MSFRALEDKVVSLCQDVMGQDVSYTPNGGSAVTIKGIFNNLFIESGGVSSLKPTLRINLSDLDSDPVKGDTVSISSTNYKVIESQQDGYGGALLILHKV